MRGKVFLFDMDGTLIDSNGVIEEIWHRWAGRHGIDGHAVLAKAHGRQAAETIRLFAPGGVDQEAETAWVNEQAARETKGIKATPGAKAFLAQLEPYEWAIVTSAKRFIAEQWLAAAGLPQPRTLIAAEDVSRSKPDPEGYRKAAQHLGCAAADAIVFEDAQAGLEAGRQAGAKVVGIGSASHLSHLADSWISSFRQVDPLRDPSGGFRLQF
ncbi:HAD-IA family hydrolase [Microvirga sp. ACRRW]|uniref:HAD-IA family hydrolase n=1 Tax=Microvirga sp. ACRRW TaxID=2918205 RepID=UPI001EF6E9F5|nr:HAD-IA family hydrolase [Microvirga sp. ACRRW]MCG7392483.1 HAD-IA family hydrolase [Microvirga sp. ACRRW]